MPQIKILPIIKSIAVALVFFALGRIMVLQMGTLGILVVAVLLIIFYSIWWVNYRRDKKK